MDITVNNDYTLLVSLVAPSGYIVIQRTLDGKFLNSWNYYPNNMAINVRYQNSLLAGPLSYPHGYLFTNYCDSSTCAGFMLIKFDLISLFSTPDFVLRNSGSDNAAIVSYGLTFGNNTDVIITNSATSSSQVITGLASLSGEILFTLVFSSPSYSSPAK